MPVELKMTSEELTTRNEALHVLARYQADIISVLVLREMIEALKPAQNALLETERALDRQHAALNKETEEPLIHGVFTGTGEISYQLDPEKKSSYHQKRQELRLAEREVTVPRLFKASWLPKTFDHLKAEAMQALCVAIVQSGPFVVIDMNLDALLAAREKAKQAEEEKEQEKAAVNGNA